MCAIPFSFRASSFNTLFSFFERLLSSNFFDCSTSDFSNLAPVTDSVLWQAQCEYSCPALNEFGTEWPETQALYVDGMCHTDFKGSPRRTCLRGGVIRYWSEEVQDPCKGMSVLEQLKTQALLFTIPLLAFILFILVSTVFFLLHWRRKDGVIYMMQWTFSVATLFFDVWFLVAMYRASSALFLAGLVFLCFWFVSNAVYVGFCTLIFRQENIEWSISSKIPIVPIAMLSLLDVMAYRLLSSRLMAISGFLEGSRKDLRELVESLGLISVWLRDLPFVTLQILSIFWLGYAPIFSLMGMLFSCLSLVNVLAQELLRWVRFTQTTRRQDENLFTPIQPHHAQEESDVTSIRSRASTGRYNELNELVTSQANETPPIFWLPIMLMTFPLVIIGFLPHIFTLFGIPFTIGCLHRFWVAVKSRQQAPLLGNYPYENEFSWYGRRGFFLLSLNTLSFSCVFLCLLPPLTFCGLLLGLFKTLEVCFTSGNSPKCKHAFFEFRRALYWAVGHILWSYFPYLETVPFVRALTQEIAGPSQLKKHMALLWYLMFDFALPFLNLALDFAFATRLLQLYQDPLLEGRDFLYGWMLVAFVAAGNGALLEIAKLVFEGIDFGWGVSWDKFLHHAVSRSPLGNPLDVPWGYAVLKTLGAIGQDILQALVLMSTASYLGTTNRLWITKVAFSVFSASFHLSKFVTSFLFGRKITKKANFGLRSFYFLLLGAILVLVTFLATTDTFCDLNRTVSSPSILEQLGRCTSLTANLTISGLTAAYSGQFSLGTLQSQLDVVNNTLPLHLSFANLQLFDYPMNIHDNHGPLEVIFPLVQTIGSGGELFVSNNTDLTSLSFPVLTDIAAGSVTFIVDNQAKELRLRSLFSISGDLLLAFNHVVQADFASLNIISPTAALLIYANTNLMSISFPALGTLEGSLGVIANSGLEELDFAALDANLGSLYIMDNPHLVSVRFPHSVNSFRGQISGNTRLTSVDLTNLEVADGLTRISSNWALTDILLPRLYALTTVSVFTIASSPSLRSLNLTSLNCVYSFNFALENNQALEQVYINKTHYVMSGSGWFPAQSSNMFLCDELNKVPFFFLQTDRYFFIFPPYFSFFLFHYFTVGSANQDGSHRWI